MAVCDFADSPSVFITPKPLRLIGRILEIASDKDSLILDSFAGSETRTLAAPAFVGQELLIYIMTDGGTCVITVASAVNQTGNNTLPLAGYRIVFDRFHIMKHLNQALDKVGLGEHRELKAAGGDDADLLTGTKHLWLYARENLPQKHRARWRQLAGLNLKVGRAWALKETLRGLWDYTTESRARRFFTRWYGWAVRCRLAPIKRGARMLKGRLEQIINNCHHPVTNGVAEGLNSKIMTIKRKACGFTNPQHFKTAIYFHCGGLDLYPRQFRKNLLDILLMANPARPIAIPYMEAGSGTATPPAVHVRRRMPPST